MPDKFRNRYRNASPRASWWDYGWDGAYFITMCTKNRHPYFGAITNGKMHFSPQGILADRLWYEITGTGMAGTRMVGNASSATTIQESGEKHDFIHCGII